MSGINPYLWVDNNQEFEQLCKIFATKTWLTLDTEFIRETTYYAIPGLLQFSDGETNWLVDPIGIDNWIPFKQLLDSNILWVMHACSEDLEVLYQLTSTTPKNLFDTQVAAHFVGLGQSLGYQKLIDELCQIFLEKGESRTNWLKRPLSEKQLNYATDDVHYLAIGWKVLQQQLIDKNMHQYFLEDMKKLASWQVVDSESIYKKVKLSWTLSSQDEVNRLQAVAEWREKRAQIKDRPKRRILSDESLIEIAKIGPESLNDFASMETFTSRQVSIIGDSILEVIVAANKTHHKYSAVRRSVEISGSKQLIKQWKICANEIAQSHQIPPTLLFTNGLLDTVFKNHLQLSNGLPKMWPGWRENLLNDSFLEILQQQDML